MKKTSFLMALACFGLLITACNPGSNPGSESKPASSSGAASTSSKPSTSSTPTPSSSSVAPDPETYYSAPFEAGYETATKWAKGHEYKFTFSVPKHYTKVVFAFGAQMSSSSHSDRSLYTDHNGASDSDPFESNADNDGTCRIALKVNGVAQEVTHDTYGEAGLTNTEVNYFKVAEFGVNSGTVEVSMTTHASTGYRLLIGEEARLYYKAADESADPVIPVDDGEGYNITFSATNGEVWVYESGQDYSVAPVKTNTTESRDEEGKKTKWIEPEEATTLEPQVNFKVVCAAGYEIDADCLAITGEYNKIKIVSNDTEENSWIVRVTKIKSDLSIVITPKVHVDGINGYEITFALTHATAKVYVGPKDETGSNVDAGEEGKFYTRDKVAPYGYSKTEPQFNFEIVPEEGYEFNDGIEWGEATEMSSSTVSFIAPGANYNKIKKSANGGYTLTKVAGALTITAVATEQSGGGSGEVTYNKVADLSYNKDTTVVINNELTDATDPKITYTSVGGVSIVVRKNTSSSDVNVWKADYASCRWYVGHKVTISHANDFDRIVFTCDSNYNAFKPTSDSSAKTIAALEAAGITYTAADGKITLDFSAAVKTFDLVPDKQIRPSLVELYSSNYIKRLN